MNSWLHLWLGLTSGLIVLVVSLTGTLFVFCDETIEALAGNARYVQATNSPRLSSEQLISAFKQQYPDRKPFYFEVYKDPNKSFKIASGDKEQSNFTYTWLNPYTGKVQGVSSSYWFFYVVAHLHSQLLLHETGRIVVGIATIIFFFQLISGLVLWWPVNANALSQRVKFLWKKTTKWKRKNYDLHNVLGFYSLLPAILITVTGLIMAYEVLGNLTQTVFGGSTDAHEQEKKLTPKYEKDLRFMSYDQIIDHQLQSGDNVKIVRLSIPRKDSVTTLYCVAAEKVGLKSWVNGQAGAVNRYTGEFVKFPKDLQKHEQIETLNFDLHVGYWYGLPSKIFTFMVGLICTSLPITGFFIWWGRRKKEKKGVQTTSSKTFIPNKI